MTEAHSHLGASVLACVSGLLPQVFLRQPSDKMHLAVSFAWPQQFLFKTDANSEGRLLGTEMVVKCF